MVNHPVFAFANAEDYEALTRISFRDEKPDAFFARAVKKADGSPDFSTPISKRAWRSLGIVGRIRSSSTTAKPPAYQVPPATPVDNAYFSGAPFLFGSDHVMRYRAVPVAPMVEAKDFADEHYLRKALHARLTAAGAPAIVFDFQVQVRAVSELTDLETEIEDATQEWAKPDFVTVAQLTIPPQDFEEPAVQELCESLVFTPWHGIQEHRPLGGINRLRRAVYEASAAFRHIPEEPAGF